MSEEREELWLEGGGVRFVYPDKYVEWLQTEVTSLKHCYALLAEHSEKLQAEVAKYRDAPVVAWHHEVEGLSYENHYVGNIPLIVKPGEEK